ncbi:hypothetical protein SERLA73DRAFT_60289 [Serpula lacrymans var. lacrymans S7.3]|uniref:polynucleotide adenylyltransferase n=1 Tax=Serpula lacrymans var. lacrymans (strain S7.3) TaxID=936435 RepID=F8Q7Z0_SERL3|nr:hypothetical protein SERLA73DRAFT_60289 [Serpula lacrymans var. lacrymans S7.3]
MDTLPSKPPSGPRNSTDNSRRARRQRERDKKPKSNHETGSSHRRDEKEKETKDRSKEGGKGKQKEKEKVGNLLNINPPANGELGDDFIPFILSDASASDEEMSHRDDHSRSRASVREWDKGKSREHDRDGGRHSTGGKRKHDAISDEEDDWRYRRRRMEPPAASRSAPWISSINWDKCNNVPEMLHREVEAFVNYMSPSPVEDEIRGLVISLVTKAVSSAFPDAQVLPFGSYETKLYLPDGDIDLVIQSESMAYSNKVTVLHALANTLKRAKITSKVTIIAKAKVPIVKFVTNHGRLNVDISINQGNGVIAGKIVNGFLKDMHGCGFALRSLVMITKAFLNQRGMNEVYTGGLGSYSIVCLAISFLQMHPKIRSGEIDAEKNLGVLVMEFFELYGCYFNYEEVGISVRKGGTYFNKRQRGWYDFYKTNLLSIEDPTEPSNDISKGSFGIAKVRQTLAGAHGIMTSTSFLRAGILGSRREGRSYSLRNNHYPEDMSILSSILGVTQEVRTKTSTNQCLNMLKDKIYVDNQPSPSPARSL